MKLRISAFLTIFFFIPVGQKVEAKESFDYRPKRSFQIFVGPRIFQERDLETSTRFSRVSKPEVGVKISPYIFDFRLEPLIGTSYVTNSSKEVSQTKNTYHLFSFFAGTRYRFYGADFFPLVPYVETNLVYRYVRFKTRVASESSSVDGGEISAQIGGGARLSLTSRNRRLQNEIRGAWGLEDYGLDAFTIFEGPDLIRHGDIDNLGKLSGLLVGFSLYFDW